MVLKIVRGKMFLNENTQVRTKWINPFFMGYTAVLDPC